MGIFSRKNKEDKVDEATAKGGSAFGGKKEAVVSTTQKSAPASKVAGIKTKASKTSKAFRVLVRPIISEKATIGASENHYTFEVGARANKVEIKKAVEEIYGVVPVKVNIINQRGQRVRFGKSFGYTKSIKKAIVTLPKGKSIKLYEGI